MISIWKAPLPELAELQIVAGFRPEDFEGSPGENPDGRAYFAKDEKLALLYADCYGCGVIEVQLMKESYVAHFQRYEELYQGGPEIQIAIPREDLTELHRMTVRRIWHHG